ncbi:unnamed protein product, partial [Vitis vinifera]
MDWLWLVIEIQAKLQQIFKNEDNVVDVKEWATQFERVQNLESLKIVISVRWYVRFSNELPQI